MLFSHVIISSHKENLFGLNNIRRNCGTKEANVIQMTVIKKSGYCPIFKEGDIIIIKKHCFDTSINTLQKYCYATLHDIYPFIMK